MANQKVTELSAVTTLNSADLFYVITDVATTPASKKITIENAITSLTAGDFKLDQTTPQTIINGRPIFDVGLTASDLFLASGAVINFNAGASTITHSANTLTIGGSGATTLALGTNSITMTGSLGATGAGKLTKGWFTDVEITNLPTINGGTLATALSLGTMAAETATDYVAKALFDANTVLYATTDDTPAALEVTEQTLVGRLTGGNISAVAIGIADNNILQVDDASAADNDYAKFTANGIEGVPYATVLSDIGAAPTASPTFTGTITLADNCRIDLTLPTTDTYVTGNTTDSFASGYSSSVGDLVFFGSSGKWLEVDADAVATCKGLMGIALEAKSDTQAMKVALPGSFVRLDAWNWTVGATLYAGETLGAMQEAIPKGADAIIKVVGFAVSADVIYFNPSPDQQSTIA